MRRFVIDAFGSVIELAIIYAGINLSQHFWAVNLYSAAEIKAAIAEYGTIKLA